MVSEERNAIVLEKENTRRNHADNELIKLLEKMNLDPTPIGKNPNSWLATCSSGGRHFLSVETKTNTWGCGYCRKSGDLKALKEWRKSRR